MTTGLAQRRLALVERSRAERAALVAMADPLLRKAVAMDRMYTRIRRHPITVAGIAIAVVVLGTRKLVGLATYAATIYRLFRR